MGRNAKTSEGIAYLSFENWGNNKKNEKYYPFMLFLSDFYRFCPLAWVLMRCSDSSSLSAQHPPLKGARPPRVWQRMASARQHLSGEDDADQKRVPRFVFVLRSGFCVKLFSQTGDPKYRRVQIVEGVRFGNLCWQFRANSTKGPSSLHSDHVMGFLDRFANGLEVQWPQSTQIDHL